MTRAALSEIIIDPETGAVSLANGVELHPFGGVPISWPDPLDMRSVWDVENGYVWHEIGGAQLANEPCIVKICAFLNSIERINFEFVWDWAVKPLYDDPGEVERQIELGCKGLAAILNRPFSTGSERFPWGLAHSVYDGGRQGVPHIGLWYDPPPEIAT